MKFATTLLSAFSLCALLAFIAPLQAQNASSPTPFPTATPIAVSNATPQITIVEVAPPVVSPVPPIASNAIENATAPSAPKSFSDVAPNEDRVLDIAPRDVAPRDIGEEWLRFDTSLKSTVSRMGLKLPLPQARVVILKSQRRLELWSGKKLVKVYSVALGANPYGAKQKQHDNRTPEGHFYICTRNNSNSAFHVFLGLSYPALPDAQRGAKTGLINAREYQMIRNRLASRGAPLWETRLGGWVGIHGGTGKAFAQKQSAKRGRADWTAGCIAVTDREIEEIHSATVLGTPVWVRP